MRGPLGVSWILSLPTNSWRQVSTTATVGRETEAQVHGADFILVTYFVAQSPGSLLSKPWPCLRPLGLGWDQEQTPVLRKPFLSGGWVPCWITQLGQLPQCLHSLYIWSKRSSKSDVLGVCAHGAGSLPFLQCLPLPWVRRSMKLSPELFSEAGLQFWPR